MANTAATAALCALVLFSWHPPAGAQGRGPFADVAGSWTGGGSISVSNGSSERIRCRVSYELTSGGNQVQQELRCASDSYKFELSSTVVSRGSSLSGHWMENTRNVGGAFTGRVSPGEIEGVVESSGFSATISITTRGDRQSVKIRSQSEIREVSIDLRRGGR